MCQVLLCRTENGLNQETVCSIACTKDPQMIQNSQGSAKVPTAGGSFYGKRLIFFGAAESKTESALLQLFSQYGEVGDDIFIVRSALGISSGCGHVTFGTSEQAKAALQALKGTTECAEPGTTLGVLLVEEGPCTSTGHSSASNTDAAASSSTPSAASPKASTHAQPEHKCGKSVFFTKVPPTVTSQQLIQLFSACGQVAHLELFIPWPGAKISRGCGLVEFTCSSAAAAAVHSMHQQFTWPHSHSALVVEWVDRNRQSSNSKGHKARTMAGNVGPAANSNAAGPAHSPAGALPHLAGATLRTDQFLPAAAVGAGFNWRPAPPMQQQHQPAPGRSSHSCPLPQLTQLPPGWHVIGTAQQLPPAGRMARPGMASQWASVPSSLSSLAGVRPQQSGGAGLLPQQLAVSAGGDAGSLTLQQQQLLLQQQHQCNTVVASEPGATGSWLACPTTTTLSNASMDMSSMASLGTVYDPTLLSSSTFSSGANSAVLHSWEKQQQQGTVLDLSACDLAAANSKNSLGSSSFGQQQFSEPMMPVSAGPGAGYGGISDPLLQQLLQQNVMLLQTMTPPPEEDNISQQLLLPTSGAGQQSGLGGGMPSFVTSLPLAQQLQSGQMLYTGSSLPSAQPQRQQVVWLQPGQSSQAPAQQQQQGNAAMVGARQQAVVVLPLSQRQLSAMSGVLPEVPRLTGAQAWISSDQATGVLQLCLSGTYPQLQAGHTAVAMLLSKAGVDEPLSAAVVTS